MKCFTQYLKAYGDYNYPNIDVSREEQTRIRRDIENQVLANKSSAASQLLSPTSSTIDLTRPKGKEGVRTRKSLSNLRRNNEDKQAERGRESGIESGFEREQEDIPQHNQSSYTYQDGYKDDDENEEAEAASASTSTHKPHNNDFSYSYREPNPWD